MNSVYCCFCEKTKSTTVVLCPSALYLESQCADDSVFPFVSLFLLGYFDCSEALPPVSARQDHDTKQQQVNICFISTHRRRITCNI